MSTPRHLTWLYVPGDAATRIAKALSSEADCVIVDLEDAVLPTLKAQARAVAFTALDSAAQQGRSVQVRLNAISSPWAVDDLAMVRRLPLQVGVRVPKVESAAQVRVVAQGLPGHELHLLIESALGVERAFELAGSDERVTSIGLGEADLKADLGVTDEAGLQWARSRLVNASVAAGLGPPSMSVYPDVKNVDGLRRSCGLGRSLGFLGRAAIHPAQLTGIRETFTPTETELHGAHELLTAAAQAVGDGRGAVALPDGRFVDEAVLRQARRVIDVGRPDRG